MVADHSSVGVDSSDRGLPRRSNLDFQNTIALRLANRLGPDSLVGLVCRLFVGHQRIFRRIFLAWIFSPPNRHIPKRLWILASALYCPGDSFQSSERHPDDPSHIWSRRFLGLATSEIRELVALRYHAHSCRWRHSLDHVLMEIGRISPGGALE